MKGRFRPFVNGVRSILSKIDRHYSRSLPSLRFRMCHVLWAVLLLIPLAVSVELPLRAIEMWDPYAREDMPAFPPSRLQLALQLWFACFSATFLAFGGLIHLLDAVSRLAMRGFGVRRIHWMIVVMLPIPFALACIRMLLPIEDPYDGAGSPTAAFFGLMVYAVFATLFAAPGLLLLSSRSEVRKTE